MLTVLIRIPAAVPVEEGLCCVFRGQPVKLQYQMQRQRRPTSHRVGLSNRQLDTLSNYYSPARQYIEIVRQDDPLRPRYGIALGFEFHDSITTFPYSPSRARLQFKDFAWGGVEFSQRDSFNFTGVTNDVSDDLTVRVDAFYGDTMVGRFSGLLLSGAGPMAQIDSGYFRVMLYRRE